MACQQEVEMGYIPERIWHTVYLCDPGLSKDLKIDLIGEW